MEFYAVDKTVTVRDKTIDELIRERGGTKIKEITLDNLKAVVIKALYSTEENNNVAADFLHEEYLFSVGYVSSVENLEKILSTFKFIEKEKPCAQEDASERISCFMDYVDKNPIPEDVINSDDELKKYFSENLGDLEFSGISRGKFNKSDNKNRILVSMSWGAGKYNQTHLFILKENTKNNWDVSHEELDPFVEITNEPKILVKGEPAFFIGHTNYTGGTCVPVSWSMMVYRLEKNKFNLLWSTEYFADGEIDNPKQTENANPLRQLEIFGANITYKDLDNDGSSEIIKEGTRQTCEGEDACYSSDCTKFFGEENIYEVYKWDAQKQTFVKNK
jgi:hypothetical protein